MNTRLLRMADSQAGLALVEVMIAMLIGLFLVGGMMQVFSSSRLTYRVHEATARMQETGRMALEVLSRDVRMAGFWGCASNPASVVNNLNPAGSGYIDFSAGGLAGTDGGAGAPDTFTVRGGSDSGITVEPPYGPQPSASLKVASDNGLEFGDIVLISDCSGADIFQITNANPDTSGTLVHNTGSGVAPGNFNATNPGCPGSNAHCLSRVYGADATIFSVEETSYRVEPGLSGEPMLLRNGVEFLESVEDLQVLYGEDTDPPGAAGFGVANYYVPADQVGDMGRVISVRFAVVVRSEDENLTGGTAQGYTVLGSSRVALDTRLRQVYTTTVTIRNRL